MQNHEKNVQLCIGERSLISFLSHYIDGVKNQLVTNRSEMEALDLFLYISAICFHSNPEASARNFFAHFFLKAAAH